MITDNANSRCLYVEMDHEVVGVYGWVDLDLGHGLHKTAQGLLSFSG